MRRSPVLVVAAALIAAGCASDTPSAALDASNPPVPTSTTDAPATTAATTTSTSTTTAPTTSTTTTTTTAPTTTTSPTTSTAEPPPPPPPPLSNTMAEFGRLAEANAAATMTVRRDGRVVAAAASGITIDGAPATSSSPMVVASVSKLLTALTIARLHRVGLVDVDAPVPWSITGVSTHPGWSTVTLRELLHHTSGMPVVRDEWFRPAGECRSFLPTLVDRPPRDHRGEWTYSNGNYCALGLVVEAIVGRPLDRSVGAVLTDPDDAADLHLTDGGQRPGDVLYGLGVDRLDRLGGAGSFIVSTDAVAAALDSVSADDRSLMTWPGVLVDQYGWGHTGTVDGAKACAWVLEDGRTVVAVTVSGGSPSTGGVVCDRIVEALAIDLGLGAGRPDRSPPGFPGPTPPPG